MQRSYGPYDIEDCIGSGGMGVVYRARHRDLQRVVALKVLRSDNCNTDDLRRRFARETHVCIQLNHPNLVRVLDCGEEGSESYLAMEYIDGKSLADCLPSDVPVDYRCALSITGQLLQGLAELSRMNIVHRDIKPANVMLTQSGGVKLIDFGLGRVLESTALTNPGAFIGTVMYMAPELWDEQTATQASDLWALGCILYRMLTGRVPWDTTSRTSIILSITSGVVPRPRTFVAGLPDAVDQFVVDLLRKNPGDRPRVTACNRKIRHILQISPDSPYPRVTFQELGSERSLSCVAVSPERHTAGKTCVRDDTTLPHRSRVIRWKWLVAASVVAVGLAFLLLPSRRTRPTPPKLAPVEPLIMRLNALARWADSVLIGLDRAGSVFLSSDRRQRLLSSLEDNTRDQSTEAGEIYLLLTHRRDLGVAGEPLNGAAIAALSTAAGLKFRLWTNQQMLKNIRKVDNDRLGIFPGSSPNYNVPIDATGLTFFHDVLEAQEAALRAIAKHRDAMGPVSGSILAQLVTFPSVFGYCVPDRAAATRYRREVNEFLARVETLQGAHGVKMAQLAADVWELRWSQRNLTGRIAKKMVLNDILDLIRLLPEAKSGLDAEAVKLR